MTELATIVVWVVAGVGSLVAVVAAFFLTVTVVMLAKVAQGDLEPEDTL